MYDKEMNCAHCARRDCCFSYLGTLAFCPPVGKLMKDI